MLLSSLPMWTKPIFIITSSGTLPTWTAHTNSAISGAAPEPYNGSVIRCASSMGYRLSSSPKEKGCITASGWERKSSLPIEISYGKQLIRRWHKNRRILTLCSICCATLDTKQKPESNGLFAGPVRSVLSVWTRWATVTLMKNCARCWKEKPHTSLVPKAK